MLLFSVTLSAVDPYKIHGFLIKARRVDPSDKQDSWESIGYFEQGTAESTQAVCADSSGVSYPVACGTDLLLLLFCVAGLAAHFVVRVVFESTIAQDP